MSATATTPDFGAAVRDMQAKLKSLHELGASTQQAVEALRNPVNQLRATKGGDGLSWIERGAEQTLFYETSPRLRESMNPYKRMAGALPKGYEPCEEWASTGGLGRMLQEGVMAHYEGKGGDKERISAFKAKYVNQFKACEPWVKEAANLQPALPGEYKAIQGMSESVGSDGGFAVFPEFSAGIMERMYTNNLLDRTDGYVVAGNTMIFHASAETSRANGSRAGGILSYMVPEGGAITKSKPTLRRVHLRLCKVAVLMYLTEELLADARALEAYAMRQASAEIAFRIGEQLFSGVGGMGAPLGILNSPAFLAITPEPGQDPGTIVTQNLDKMYHRRLNVTGANYEWYCNQDCGPSLDNLDQKIGLGGYPLNRGPGYPSIGPAPGQQYKGLPINQVEWCSSVGTVGDFVLADFGQVLSITKGGIVQSASPHVEFLTDQLAVKWTYRFDARPWDVTPITPFKGTNTQSPFLGIATR